MELAVEDYRKAGDLIVGHEDSYEPDGAPNARNKFLGSDRGKIHYYRGQTSYALGDYATTLERMTLSSREPLVQTADHQIATLYWRYLALRELGRHEEAVDLVREVVEALISPAAGAIGRSRAAPGWNDPVGTRVRYALSQMFM